MLRLLVPLAGIISFFLLSLVTVRTLKPRQPRLFFLSYALLLLMASAAIYLRFWPLETMDDMVGLASCLLLQMLMCLTMWNAFYSLLWGFSGGLMHDLYNDERLRQVDRLIGSYERDTGLDRILSRRLPNLESGGYLEVRDGTLRLRWKGRLIALGTLAAFKVFSLGMGGGIKQPMLASLAFAAFVLLAAQTVLVAVASAMRPKGNVYVTIILVSVCTAPLALVYGTYHLGAPLGSDGRLHFVLIHLALGGFLFHFMTLPDRSVTLRILVEVLGSPGQALSLSALGARYGVKTMISSRLDQLSAGGFIEVSGDGRITLTSKGLAFGRFVSGGRRLFGIASAN